VVTTSSPPRRLSRFTQQRSAASTIGSLGGRQTHTTGQRIEADAHVSVDAEAAAYIELTADLDLERGQLDAEQVRHHPDRPVLAGRERCAEQVARVRRIVQPPDMASRPKTSDASNPSPISTSP
jgi:hypothetical protein